MVKEIESLRLGSNLSSPLTKEDLPAPDGADTIKRLPEVEFFAVMGCTKNVKDLCRTGFYLRFIRDFVLAHAFVRLIISIPSRHLQVL